MNKALRTGVMFVMLGALVPPAAAHKLERYHHVGKHSFTDHRGKVAGLVTNKYQSAMRVELQIMDYETFQIIPDDQWRSDIEMDRLTLKPKQAKRFFVQFREKGKYRVCTKAIAQHTRNCFPAWYR